MGSHPRIGGSTGPTNARFTVSRANWTQLDPIKPKDQQLCFLILKMSEDRKRINDDDIKEVFRMVDVDRSGAISRTEAKMAAKLLEKNFGIKNVLKWLKESDTGDDGKLTYREFKEAIIKLQDETDGTDE